MLVLTRKPGEAIIVETSAGPMRIVLVSAGQGKGQIGVEAPRSWPVWRGELHREAMAANREQE